MFAYCKEYKAFNRCFLIVRELLSIISFKISTHTVVLLLPEN